MTSIEQFIGVYGSLETNSKAPEGQNQMETQTVAALEKLELAQPKKSSWFEKMLKWFFTAPVVYNEKELDESNLAAYHSLRYGYWY